MENKIKSINRLSDGTINRVEQVRRDDDNYVTPAITIYDIDYAILYHLQNNMNLQIEENGKQVQVPVMFAAGEMWAQIQKNGFLRDKNRKVMTPVLIINRTSMSYDDRYEKLRIPKSQNFISYKIKDPQQKNDRYNRINQTKNSLPSETVYLSTIPDRVTISYDLIIWTELTSQLNKIVDVIRDQHKLVWGDAMSFLTKVTNFSFEQTNLSGTDRVVRANVSLEVDGILQNEFELSESSVNKAHSIKRTVFNVEIEEF